MLPLTLRGPANGIDAKFFTREVLEGKDKTPGWVQMTMAKFPVLRQLLNLVATVPSSNGTATHDAKQKIHDTLGAPEKFCQTFHAQEINMDDLESQEADGGLEESALTWAASTTDLAQITEKMPKCVSVFADNLYNIFAGDYDEEMTALAGTKSARDTLMDDDQLGGVSPTLQCKLREALRLVASAANQFTTCEQEQEKALVTVRSLKRVASNPDDTDNAALKERTQLWEKAREQRRKFVTLLACPQPTRAKLEGVVSKMPPSKLGY